MIGLLYINMFVLLFVILMLIPISKQSMNFFTKSIISLTIVVIINSLFVFIPSLFDIPSSLLLRTILFGSVDLLGLIYIKIKKSIQKLDFRFRDIIVFLFIICLTLVLGKYRFKENFDLIFETTDPATHYIWAERFSETNELSEKRNNKDLFYVETEQSTMFLSYTTLGTVFQIEDEFGLNQITHVYSFIVFELIVLAFTGYMIYAVIVSTSKKFNFISFILIMPLLVLAISGYPYNNLIFGFHYLGISILFMLLLIYLMDKVIQEKSKSLILISSLIAFSIFTTYYMFVPIIYGACGVYFLFKCFVNKSTTIKETIKYIFFILVIPFIIGIWYYFIRNHFVSDGGVSGLDTFKLEGYIYRNLIGNFIILLIATVSKLIYDIKNKSIRLSDITLIFAIAFLVILFVPFYKGDIASYYFYKLYYVMWPICFIILGESFYSCELEFSQKTFSRTILVMLTIIFALEIKDVDTRLYERNPLINTRGFTSNIADIYTFNKSRTNREISKPIYSNKELKDIIDLSDKYKESMKEEITIFYAELLPKLWFYDLSRVNPNGNKDYLGAFYEENMDYQTLYGNKDIKYVVCYIENCKDISNKYYDYEYKNDSFGLLVRKNNNKIR